MDLIKYNHKFAFLVKNKKSIHQFEKISIDSDANWASLLVSYFFYKQNLNRLIFNSLCCLMKHTVIYIIQN